MTQLKISGYACRIALAAGILAALVPVAGCGPIVLDSPAAEATPPYAAPSGSPLAQLSTLDIKGRAPRTGYDRDRYGQRWADVDRNGCDTRNDMLRRDLIRIVLKRGSRGCAVSSGVLRDPYTGRTVTFRRGGSSEVDIDHVVSLSGAWQTGAYRWDARLRVEFANDPLNLISTTASANRSKGDGDAATWLPPNRRYRCAFVARQVAVKVKYRLWVTRAERAAMERVLLRCRTAGASPTASPPSYDASTPVSTNTA